MKALALNRNKIIFLDNYKSIMLTVDQDCYRLVDESYSTIVYLAGNKKTAEELFTHICNFLASKGLEYSEFNYE